MIEEIIKNDKLVDLTLQDHIFESSMLEEQWFCEKESQRMMLKHEIISIKPNAAFVSRAQFPFKLFSLKKGRFQTRAREAKKTVAKVRQIDEFDALNLGIDPKLIPYTFCLIDLNPTVETPRHEVKLQKEIYPERQINSKIVVLTFQYPQKVERFLAIRTGNLEAEKPTIVSWHMKSVPGWSVSELESLAKMYKPQLFRITVRNYAVYYKTDAFESLLEPLQIPIKEFELTPNSARLVFQISFQTRSQQSKENKLGGTGENGYMLVVKLQHCIDHQKSFFLEPVKLSLNVSDDEEPKRAKKKRLSSLSNLRDSSKGELTQSEDD
jgi:hypothetical protein